MKTCPRCQRAQPRTEYSPHRRGADGLQARCKTCRAELQRTYRRTPQGREVNRRGQRAYLARTRGRDAAKADARIALNNAVRLGQIVRPDECDRCGEPGVTTLDGRASIQAHHADYSRPLDVEWLCTRCHTAEHKTLRIPVAA